jgi:ADP-ribose pyrophosphatase
MRGDNMNFEEKTLEREYIYKGKIINLRKDKVLLPNGNTSIREIVEHNGGVAIVAINEKNDVIMVKQYRKPYDEVLLEIPAGKLEKEEEHYDCAVRELQEEIGFKPLELKLMNVIYPSPGFANEKLYIYFCNKMIKGSLKMDEDETIEVEYIPYDEAVNMIYEGKIKDGKTIVGILMAKKYI